MSKAGRKSEYKDGFAAMVRELSGNPVSIMVRGRVSDTKLAVMCGVSRETIRLWKTPVAGREGQYQAEFAKAVQACQDAVDSGEIKRAMVERARGFVQRKKIKELQEVGPSIPFLNKMEKAEIISEAKRVLGITINDQEELEIVRMQVRAEIEKQTKLKMVLVKDEQVTMAGDVAAAKLVLNNIQKQMPVDEQWDTREKTDAVHHVDGLEALLREIGSAGTGLPIKE